MLLVLQKCNTKRGDLMKFTNTATLLSTIKCLLHGFLIGIVDLH